MRVLTFAVGDHRCALDGSLVRRIVDAEAEEGPEGTPSYDLARLFPAVRASWSAKVVLELDGQALALRTTSPEGFRQVRAASLVPLPPYLFSGEKRPVRAVFLDSAEFVLTVLTPTTLFGDLNCDGLVGLEDLLGLLSIWGPCVGCSADFDSDGEIGPADLANLIDHWD